jgi:hypothetical protein
MVTPKLKGEGADGNSDAELVADVILSTRGRQEINCMATKPALTVDKHWQTQQTDAMTVQPLHLVRCSPAGCCPVC